MAEIKLTQGFVALVDDEDYERLSGFKWHAARYGRDVYYAIRERRPPGKRGSIYMHREIMEAGPGEKVDHKVHPVADEKIIDNRKANLRKATHAENMRNCRRHKAGDSIFKGVQLDKRNPKKTRWVARISPARRHVFLGSFQNEGYAALMHDIAAVRMFGEFARTNFPIPGSTQWHFGTA